MFRRLKQWSCRAQQALAQLASSVWRYIGHKPYPATLVFGADLFQAMGVVSSVGSKMMRPPVPASYAVTQAGEFSDGWEPLDESGCPIRFRWPAELRSFEARERKASTLAYEIVRRETTERHSIAILRVYGQTPRPLLLYSKGNSFDLGILRFHCVQLALLLDVDVIAYDYSGYGVSDGRPSVASTIHDADAAFEYARSFDQDIVLYGFSLGNGPTLHLAANNPGKFRGVVLRSPFASGVAVATDLAHRLVSTYLPVFSLPSFLDVWPCADLITKVRAPTLIIHGDQDELIRPWQPRKLLANCKTPVDPFFRPNMGHFDVERDLDYLDRLRRFLTTELL